MKKKLLSIITVVKNDRTNIGKTIKSILNQKGVNFEYIIIDGKSNDGTLQEIEKYKKKINKIISQKDKGIYHAMNKGIKNSKGDVIVFCNSGDTFYKNALRKVMNIFHSKNVDYVFGTVMRHYTKGRILKYGINLGRIFYNFDFATSHTTGFFLKKKVYNEIGNYNTKFKISADYDFYYRLIKKNKFLGDSTTKNSLIGKVSSGGFSSKFTFIDHCIEESKIRIHNKQNLIFVVLIFINSILKNIYKIINDINR